MTAAHPTRLLLLQLHLLLPLRILPLLLLLLLPYPYTNSYSYSSSRYVSYYDSFSVPTMLITSPDLFGSRQSMSHDYFFSGLHAERKADFHYWVC